MFCELNSFIRIIASWATAAKNSSWRCPNVANAHTVLAIAWKTNKKKGGHHHFYCLFVTDLVPRGWILMWTSTLWFLLHECTHNNTEVLYAYGCVCVCVCVCNTLCIIRYNTKSREASLIEPFGPGNDQCLANSRLRAYL